MGEGKHDLGGFIRRFRNQPRPQNPLALPRDEPAANTDFLELNRERVATEMRSLFMGADRRVATMIGYDGSILEAIYKAKPKDLHDTIDMDKVPPVLRPYYQHGIFHYRLDKVSDGGPPVMFNIDTQTGDFHPKILMNSDEGSLQVSTVEGNGKFDYCHIKRTYKDENGQTRNELTQEVDTFYPNHKMGQPDVALRVTSHGVGLNYVNPNENGDVELEHDGTIRIGGAIGRYSAAEKNFEWENQQVQVGIGDRWPQSSYDEATQQVVIKPDWSADWGETRTLKFPVKDNIYQRLQAIISGFDKLSQPTTSKLSRD